MKWKFKKNILKDGKGNLVASFINSTEFFNNKPSIRFGDELYITKIGGSFTHNCSMESSKEALYATNYLYGYKIKILNIIDKTEKFAILKRASIFSSEYKLNIDNCMYTFNFGAIFNSGFSWVNILNISGENRRENLSVIVFCIYILNFIS